jgi:hypothetical protein
LAFIISTFFYIINKPLVLRAATICCDFSYAYLKDLTLLYWLLATVFHLIRIDWKS